MRLVNHTDVPTDLVRDILAFVRPPGIAGFDVRISNCGSGPGRGRAYPGGSSYHDRRCPFVIASIPKTDAAARHYWHKPTTSNPDGGWKGYLPIPVGNRVEAIVMILAHELRHLWQRRVPTGRRVYGARGVYSERDADAYAKRMLRAWRRRDVKLPATLVTAATGPVVFVPAPDPAIARRAAKLAAKEAQAKRLATKIKALTTRWKKVVRSIAGMKKRPIATAAKSS